MKTVNLKGRDYEQGYFLRRWRNIVQLWRRDSWICQTGNQAGTWGGKDEEALFGDLGVKGIDKAHAIDVLLEHLNAKKSDTIAFGDAKVDIPMFEYCEQSVCLGNGGDEAKKAADMVTQAVDDDGLASAFYKLGLI